MYLPGGTKKNTVLLGKIWKIQYNYPHCSVETEPVSLSLIMFGILQKSGK